MSLTVALNGKTRHVVVSFIFSVLLVVSVFDLCWLDGDHGGAFQPGTVHSCYVRVDVCVFIIIFREGVVYVFFLAPVLPVGILHPVLQNGRHVVEA